MWGCGVRQPFPRPADTLGMTSPLAFLVALLPDCHLRRVLLDELAEMLSEWEAEARA